MSKFSVLFIDTSGSENNAFVECTDENAAMYIVEKLSNCEYIISCNNI